MQLALMFYYGDYGLMKEVIEGVIMDQNDYEELLKKGYTEEQIKVALDSLSQINVSEGPMRPNRDDRSVSVRDANNLEKRTTSIMMGYNKQGIRLENGEYVSFTEFEDAIKESMASDKENEVYVCKKTGKRVEPVEIVENIYKDVIEAQSSLILSEDNVITNQTSAKIAIRDPHLKQTINKGILMLGNEGIQLSSGDYVFLPELQESLNDYVKMSPNVKPIPPIVPQLDPKKQEEEIEHLFPEQKKEEPIKPSKQDPVEPKKEKHRVIKRIRKKASLIPLIVGAAAVLLTGFGMKDQITTRDIQTVSQSIDFEAIGISETEVLETQDEIIRRVASEIETGQQLEVQEGVTYHESSNYKYGGADASNEFGNDLRKAGNYTVDYISVLHEGQIVQVEVEKGKNLGDVLDKVSSDLGVPVSELEPMIHLGGAVSGWVSADELYKEEDLIPKVTDTNVVLDESECYTGSIDNFQGDSITINNGVEDVSLRIKDEQGALIEEGSIVVGSDGQEYRMSKLKSEEKVHTDTVEEKTGSELTWSFHNIDKEFALLAGAASVGATLLSRRKKKEMTTMSDDEIDKLVNDAKERFDAQSELTRAADIMTVKEPNFETLGQQLIDHETTVEEIQSIGSGGVKR